MKKPVLRKFKINKNKPSISSGKVREKFGKKSSWRFPNIYRRITDFIRLKWRIILVGLVSFILLFCISILSFDLYKNIQEKQKIEKERQKLISEVIFWESVVNKYKDYRDAYFNLAVLEYQLKNFDKTKAYLQKVLELDPNFNEGRKLEKLLSVN